jgi:hypothetical protein
MPEEDVEPEAVGEEGEGEDGEPKPPSLPIPGAEDQFEQLNELVRNDQARELPRGAVAPEASCGLTDARNSRTAAHSRALITNQVEPLVAIEQLNGMLQRGQIGAYKYDMLFVKVWAKALDERGEGFTTTENRRSSMAKTPPSRRLSEIVRAVFRHTGRSASGDFPGLRAPSHKYVPCREPVAAPHAHIRLA